MRGGPSRGVLHTTETRWWAGTRFYHIEYRDGVFRQYRPFDRASRALRHPSGTPQTNRQGDYCINVSVTGYARESQDWPDRTYQDIAEFIAWCNDQFGIGAWSRYPVGHGGEAYGENGSARMLWDEWELFNGWCGHQEVPANTHWDAGRVDWIRLLGDDVPQFTEEEATQLKNLVAALKSHTPPSSGWGLGTAAVELIRKEREYPLHDPPAPISDVLKRGDVVQLGNPPSG
jgi:hypothetical protein